MKIKTSLFIIFILLISSMGFTEENKKISGPYHMAQNREDSLLFIGISPIGLDTPTLLSPTVSCGFYLGNSILITGEYGQSEPDISLQRYDTSTNRSDEVDEAEFDGTFINYGVQIRIFVANSFYFLFAYNKMIFEGTGEFTFNKDDPDELKVEDDFETKSEIITIRNRQSMADEFRIKYRCGLVNV